MNIYRQRQCTSIFIVSVLLTSSNLLAQAPDTLPQMVELKSGDTLTGQVSVAKDSSNGRTYVTVQKSDGSTLKLDKSLLVRKITALTAAQIRYRRLAAAAKSMEDHRTIIAWCLEQPSGRRVFEDEIESQWREVLSIDPDDAEARRKLGYDRGDDGNWHLKEQYLAEHGYVKDGTGWKPAITLEQQNQTVTAESRLADRKSALSAWRRLARKRDVSFEELQQAMFALCDRYSVGLVDEVAQRDLKDPELRSIAVEAIGRVDSLSAMRRLVAFNLNDPDAQIRERALTLLGQEHYDQQRAAKMYAQVFNPKSTNDLIQRAAFAIGELGGDSVVSDLIEVLVTTHIEKNPNALEPGRMNAGFDRTGNSGGGGLQMGGGPQTIKRTVRNEQVLDSLTALTKANFGFDIDRWREWHIESNTHYDVNVRAD
jgi:hypothetical protein